MSYRTTRAALIAACLSLVLAAPSYAAKPQPTPTPTATPAPTGEAIPNSMSAIGDSITKGFNACGFYVDCPTHSWSAGTTNNSHYQRILAKNGSISGKNFNDSVTGADSADLATQATAVTNRHVDYVTVLMGANDACTSSEATMTDVATFGSRYSAALSQLANGTPGIRILAVSIPDIKRLWSIGKDSASARTAWNTYNICQSMLANPTSTLQADVDRRNRVQQRVIDYNVQIANACTATPHCKFDGNAVFNYQFVLSQVSGWDYFHPNDSGQQVLAEQTWRNGFGW